MELLKELVKLQNKSSEDWYIPSHPVMPMQPYYKEPTLEPPYKIGHEIFPMSALAVLGALEGKTAEEMAQSLLEQEEEMAKERSEK